MSIVGREPVIIQALAAIVVWAATRYGLNISDEQALQIAGGAFVVLAPFVRQLVTPTAKLDEPLTPEEQRTARALLAAKYGEPAVEQEVDQTKADRIAKTKVELPRGEREQADSATSNLRGSSL